jgi:hypothetical protein
MFQSVSKGFSLWLTFLSVISHTGVGYCFTISVHSSVLPFNVFCLLITFTANVSASFKHTAWTTDKDPEVNDYSTQPLMIIHKNAITILALSTDSHKI